jgi:glucan phosphorylase
MAKVLSDLIDRMPVALISGGSMADFERQVLSGIFNVKKENLYLLPTSGAELRFWQDGAWKTAYSFPVNPDKKEKLLSELSKAVGVSRAEIDAFVDDRGCQLTYSGLGKDASLSKKYAWDPRTEKRRVIIAKLQPRLSGLSMRIGGSTSIDFTEEGVDKAFGVSKLLEHLDLSPKDAVFVGDAMGEGGNDAPVATLGVKSITTASPEVTREIVLRMMQDITREIGGVKKHTIAFFCMEYGIEEDIPLFAGGLGILAGDMVKEAGRRDDVQFVAFGLISRKGMKTEGSADIDYTDRLIHAGFRKALKNNKPILVRIPLGGLKDISVSVWEKSYGSATLYFLDTDVDENLPNEKTLTDYLYDMDKKRRTLQEIILGVGSAKLLSVLDITPDVYHFNEGHTGFAALSCILEYGQGDTFSKRAKSMRDNMVGTKHTILSGAGTYLSHAEFDEYLGTYIRSKGIKPEEVYGIGALERNRDTFSTTRFLMQVSGKTNGVSCAHVSSEKAQYPQSKLKVVTNGVDVSRWQAPRLSKDGDGRKSSVGLVEAKKALRRELVSYVNKVSGSDLRDDILTIVWARRFAAYKRPGLLWNDLKQISSLINDAQTPVQIIVAGKAHPLDMEGVRAKSIVENVVTDPKYKGRVAYMPGYSIDTAKLLVKGADVWLNTPIPGFEACGTSGMKAGLNGTLVMSTDDGWVAEEPILRDIGFIISEDEIEKNIYNILKDKVVPGFYGKGSVGNSDEWTARMRQTITLVEAKFNSARMLDDYIKKMYNFNS